MIVRDAILLDSGWYRVRVEYQGYYADGSSAFDVVRVPFDRIAGAMTPDEVAAAIEEYAAAQRGNPLAAVQDIDLVQWRAMKDKGVDSPIEAGAVQAVPAPEPVIEEPAPAGEAPADPPEPAPVEEPPAEPEIVRGPAYWRDHPEEAVADGH